ncbi:MAG TPA: shikimate kinase, partial [Solirubrobacteraceae bacterium]|nr:shikimate kinase [Solirubrobacteraceae bacterium]
MALVLIGFMGAGKSTLAQRLARARDTDAGDSDVLLAERFGHSVALQFELHGEQAFREAEEQVIGRLLADAGPRDVIALGGGSVLSKRTREALADHLVALVEVDVDVAWGRVHAENEGSDRPLARDRDAFGVLYDERRELYEEVADARLLWAESASGSYPVLIGSGLLGLNASGSPATTAGER